MKEKRNWIEVPFEAMRDKRLNETARLTLGYIRLCQNKKEFAFPTIETIAREINKSPSQVKKALKLLQKTGWIKRKYRKGPHGISTSTVVPSSDWKSEEYSVKEETMVVLPMTPESSEEDGIADEPSIANDTELVSPTVPKQYRLRYTEKIRKDKIKDNIYGENPSIEKTEEKAVSLESLIPTEDIPKSEIAQFRDFWCQTYQTEIGSPYASTWGKDSKLIKGLLQSGISLDQLKKAVGAFFADPWYRQRADIGVFSKSINKLISSLSTSQSMQSPSTLPSRGTVEETDLYRIISAGYVKKFIVRKTGEEWDLKEALEKEIWIGQYFNGKDSFNLKKIKLETIERGIEKLAFAEAVFSLKGKDYSQITKRLEEYIEEKKVRATVTPTQSVTPSSDWMDCGRYLVNHSEKIVQHKRLRKSYPLSTVSTPLSEDEAYLQLEPYLKEPRRLKEVHKNKLMETIKNVDYIMTKAAYLSLPELEKSCGDLVAYAFAVLPQEDS